MTTLVVNQQLRRSCTLFQQPAMMGVLLCLVRGRRCWEDAVVGRGCARRIQRRRQEGIPLCWGMSDEDTLIGVVGVIRIVGRTSPPGRDKGMDQRTLLLAAGAFFLVVL